MHMTVRRSFGTIGVGVLRGSSAHQSHLRFLANLNQAIVFFLIHTKTAAFGRQTQA
jgi:hypothetical protein